MEYSAPQIAGRNEPFRSAIREPTNAEAYSLRRGKRDLPSNSKRWADHKAQRDQFESPPGRLPGLEHPPSGCNENGQGGYWTGASW
jgi:hypothetical protein